jgi:hypothetical protein
MLAVLSVPAVAQAQTKSAYSAPARMATMWGPFVGANFATFGGSSASGAGFTSKTGLTAGLEVQHHLAPSLFLRFGALYSMRGADNSGGNTNLNYIEIPVMLGYAFHMQGSRTRPYLLAGGQFAIKASCTISGAGACDAALGTKVSSTDLGATFGAGVMFPAGQRGHVVVEGRYLVGLTNLVSSAGGGAELKNKGFTVDFGYMVPLGH